MKRKIVSVSSDSIKDLPQSCGRCFYWESDPVSQKVENAKAATKLKEEWFQEALSSWGECGKIIYQGDQIIAYAQYGPSVYFPRTKGYLAGAISEDAVFLSCLYVGEQFRGRGIGKIMLRAIEKDLYKKGFKALETIAGKKKEKHVSLKDFYLKNGFFVHRQDLRFFLLRIEFKSIVSWPVNLQTALDSLILPYPARAPSPTWAVEADQG